MWVTMRGANAGVPAAEVRLYATIGTNVLMSLLGRFALWMVFGLILGDKFVQDSVVVATDHELCSGARGIRKVPRLICTECYPSLKPASVKEEAKARNIVVLSPFSKCQLNS